MPGPAAAWFDANPNCRLEGGNTHAFMAHWLGTLNSVGLVDPDVAADHPLAVVFNQGGKRTYVAYNMGDAPVSVSFTDGTKLTALPHRLSQLP